jgi:flagellar biosynthetic protein FliR
VSSDTPLLIAQIPFWAWAFTLILARVAAAAMLLPGIAEAAAPSIVRAGIALALTLVLLPVLAPLIPPQPTSLAFFGKTLLVEILDGLFLGWLARVLALALPMAGQIISYMMGISSVLQNDIIIGTGATAVGNLFSLAIPVIILGTGLYTLPLEALVGSYRILPPGQLIPPQLGAEQAVLTVATGFALALKLSSPFIIASIVWYTSVALTARLIPRIQIYFLAAPAQILGGIALFAVVATSLITLWCNNVGIEFAMLPGLR